MFGAVCTMQAGPAEVSPEALQPTAEYMGHEEAEKARTAELWQRVVKHEAMHPISLKARPCHWPKFLVCYPITCMLRLPVKPPAQHPCPDMHF